MLKLCFQKEVCSAMLPFTDAIQLQASESTKMMLLISYEREITMCRKTIMKPKNILWSTLLVLLVGAALREQLRLSPEERTWHGTIAGRIPYDFLLPTAERLRSTFWNKQTSQILVPHVFGIGWTLNLYPFFHPQTLQKLREEETIRR
jgi:hypothetical protein